MSKIAQTYLKGLLHSETFGLSLYQFYGLELGLELETQIISVSNSVSILRLRKIQSRSLSEHWDSEKSSLGLGLETETQKITVSVWKLRLKEYKSRSRSQKSILGLADHWFSFGQIAAFLHLILFRYSVLSISFSRSGCKLYTLVCFHRIGLTNMTPSINSVLDLRIQNSWS